MICAHAQVLRMNSGLCSTDLIEWNLKADWMIYSPSKGEDLLLQGIKSKGYAYLYMISCLISCMIYRCREEKRMLELQTAMHTITMLARSAWMCIFSSQPA